MVQKISSIASKKAIPVFLNFEKIGFLVFRGLIRRGLFNSARRKGRKVKTGVFVMGVLDFIGWKAIEENLIGKGIQAG